MKTAFFAKNPIWNSFDRGESPDQFAGRQTGIDPTSGNEVDFYYGAVIEAPYCASDEELDAMQ